MIGKKKNKTNNLTCNPPNLLAHWQAPRARLKQKLAKELTNANPMYRL